MIHYFATLADTPTADVIWALVGVIGQTLFFSRFLVQWLSSERQKRSVMPVAFWYFSFVGGTVTLVYAIHLGSIVFTLGQAGGLLVYARNLVLIWRERRRVADHG